MTTASQETYGPDGRPIDGPRTTAAESARNIARWAAVDRGQSTERLPASLSVQATEYAVWRGAAFLEGDLYSEAIRGANAMRRARSARRYFGIYRERARSAVLVVLLEDRDAAMARAEALSNTHGPHLVAESTNTVIHYNDPTAPRAIHRFGDWDSRSAWQPYPAPRVGPREAALIAERAQPGDTCSHAINSDCPHYE